MTPRRTAQKEKRPTTKRRKKLPAVTDNRLRLYVIWAALGVAALAIGLEVLDPSVFTFLGLVVTVLLRPDRS